MKTDRPRLLLVETDPEVLRVIPTFMRRVGDVRIAEDTSIALEWVQREGAHVLIASYRMLDEDPSLLRALRQRQPCAQVMVLCEQHTAEVSTGVLGEGVGDILVKPFDVAGLQPRLERLLAVMREQQRRARTQLELEARMRHHDRVALLGTIVATVAHDVANPLSVVSTNAVVTAGIVDTDAPITQADRDVLRAATKDTFDAAGVIKEYLSRILKFSRREKAHAWDHDLADTLSMALLFVRARARDRGVTIHVQSLANVPAIRHHAAAFAQAVVNALTNAIDAAADEGSVWLRFEDAAEKVDVIVEDDGPGLSEEQERCVWDAFYTTKVNGTGLGTVVMRQVMHEHGGSVELKNLGDGRGLSVRLALPKRNSSRPPAERYVAT